MAKIADMEVYGLNKMLADSFRRDFLPIDLFQDTPDECTLGIDDGIGEAGAFPLELPRRCGCSSSDVLSLLNLALLHPVQNAKQRTADVRDVLGKTVLALLLISDGIALGQMRPQLLTAAL